MSKLHKGFLSGALVCFMTLTTFTGLNSLNNVSTVFAKSDESKELQLVKKKIEHLTYSLKNNYLGIKNQGQWERYITDTRKVIDTMPRKEGIKAREFSIELDRAQELVNAVARINQVEKSMETNFHGVKNANRWGEYLDLARKSLIMVDQKIYMGPHDSLQMRKETCQRVVDSVIESFNKDYKEAEKKYDNANFTMNIDDAIKALKAAEALGTCEKSDSLEDRCKNLISRIQSGDIEINNLEVEAGTFDDNTRNQVLSIKVNYKITDVDYLKKIGYNVEFKGTKLDGVNADIFYNQSSTSSSGILADNIDTGVYKIEVTLTKDSVKTRSEKATIVIKDLNPEKNEITDYKIYNFGADTKDLGAMDNDCFTQNSNTLVVGEQFNISEIKYKKGDSTSSITTGFTISSSDTSVIDVTSSGLLGKKLIASSKGTARIKIDYMGTTKEVTVTVKDEERRFDSININERTVTAYKGEQTIIRVSAVDQYGDPITAKVLSDADINVDPFENGSVTPLANGTLGSKGSQGEVQWKLIPGSVGSGTICFKNKKGDIIGKIYLNVKERA